MGGGVVELVIGGGLVIVVLRVGGEEGEDDPGVDGLVVDEGDSVGGSLGGVMGGVFGVDKLDGGLTTGGLWVGEISAEGVGRRAGGVAEESSAGGDGEGISGEGVIRSGSLSDGLGAGDDSTGSLADDGSRSEGRGVRKVGSGDCEGTTGGDGGLAIA